MGVHKLAEGFKGPADFCAIQHGKGVTVYAPDLVQSHVRIIQLRQRAAAVPRSTPRRRAR